MGQNIFDVPDYISDRIRISVGNVPNHKDVFSKSSYDEDYYEEQYYEKNEYANRQERSNEYIVNDKENANMYEW